MSTLDPLRRLLVPAARLTRITDGLEISSLWRWAKLSVTIGTVVGFVAVGVYYLLELSEATLLYHLAGHQQPPVGSGQHLFSRMSQGRIWWLLLILPALGGLVAGVVVHLFSRDDLEQGSDSMVAAYHHRGGVIPLRTSVVRLVASAFTLGTGGSAGREGPMAFLGGGVGTWIGRRFKLSARDRRLLLVAGAASGIAALFRTPLGAALWSLEVLYRDDFESDGLFPALVSSVTSYSIFTSFYGEGNLFAVPGGGYEFATAQLPFYGLMAVGAAPLAVLWVKLIGAAPRAFARVHLPRYMVPALGGLMLGAAALLLPWVLGAGYGWIQDSLLPVDDPGRRLPIGYAGFGLLIGLAVAKMIATCFTVGSGGSGGLFAPSLFIGGFVGGAFGLLFHQLVPDIVTQPGAFVLVGMGAFYAGVSHVPIATIILISELFGSYDLLVPLMLVVMISMLLLRRHTLVPSQVSTAMESPAHTAKFTVDVLEKLTVDDHYSRGRATTPVRRGMQLSDFLEHVSTTAESFFVVADGEGRLVGTVSLDDIRVLVAEHEFLDFILVADAMTPLTAIAPSASLADAVEALVKSGHEFVPVVDPEKPNEVLGVISQRQVAAEYNAEILRRRLSGESPTLS